MPVSKPRNRLVNFRLSEEEFEKLRASCSLNGARSLSDFARMAVLRSVASCGSEFPGEEERSVSSRQSGPPASGTRIVDIDHRMELLESRVAELLQMISALESASSGNTSLHSAEKAQVQS